MKIVNSLMNILLSTTEIDIENCLEFYKNLKNQDIASIKTDDLPDEFGEDSFKIIDEFIKKTYYLDYECLILFDYITGEILKCAVGSEDNVSISFKEGEFENHNVASIHNHGEGIFSPPSGKDFDIINRDFEDYELIASQNELWILKAKIKDKNLANRCYINASFIFKSIYQRCSNRYNDKEIIDKIANIQYGNKILKYINDETENNIQLTKREYKNDNTHS